MKYQNISPPFTLKFWEMKKPELKKYYEWFIGQIPERVAQLQDTVAVSMKGWLADRTPGSLDELGVFFAGNVGVRKRTMEEISEIKSSSPYAIDIPASELTNTTFSYAMDLGMYLGQVVLANISGTSWEQVLSGKSNADYGQPVITGFGKVSMNPVRLMTTLAYSIADGTKTGARLRELYDIWEGMASS